MKRNAQDIYTANTMGKNRDTHIHSKGTSINTIMYTMNKKMLNCDTATLQTIQSLVGKWMEHTHKLQKSVVIFLLWVDYMHNYLTDLNTTWKNDENQWYMHLGQFTASSNVNCLGRHWRKLLAFSVRVFWSSVWPHASLVHPGGSYRDQT